MLPGVTRLEDTVDISAAILIVVIGSFVSGLLFRFIAELHVFFAALVAIASLIMVYIVFQNSELPRLSSILMKVAVPAISWSVTFLLGIIPADRLITENMKTEYQLNGYESD